MAEQIEATLYEFGPFRIDPVRRILQQSDTSVALTPKAFDTLLVLVRNSKRVVSKDRLMEKVWPDTAVEENNLTQNISVIRKALGETRSDHRYIVTVPGQGYCFVADVRESAPRNGNAAELQPPTHGSAPSGRADETHTASGEDEPADSPAIAPRTSIAGRKQTYRQRSILFRIAASRTLLAVCVGASTLGVVALSLRQRTVQPFTAAKISKFGDNTDVSSGMAISPDGRYISYFVSKDGLQSLWIRQVSSPGSVSTIVPPADVVYSGSTFSPDGNFVYYTALARNEPRPALYQVPVLGGPPIRIKDAVYQSISFSPDANRFAFVRSSSRLRENALMMSGVDENGERRLTLRKSPDEIRSPSWSPDGELVAFADGNADTGVPNIDVVAVRLKDGTETRLTKRKWQWIASVAWLPKGDGLIVIGRPTAPAPVQVWHLSYPQGEERQITNDSSTYRGLSISRDGSTIITAESGLLAAIWIAPRGQVEQAKQMGWGMTRYRGIAWTPDNLVTYASNVGHDSGLAILDPKTGSRRQLVTSANSPAVAPDGSYIVFMSPRGGPFNLWTVAPDGGNLQQLTFGSGEHFPACSPDGKWVAYTSMYSEKSTIWRVPVGGGQPAQLTFRRSSRPSISPDGKHIACFYDDGSDRRYVIAIIPSQGGDPEMLVPVPSTISVGAGVRWTPDGKALMYIDTRQGVSNIWMRPLGQTAARQLTNFNDGLMFSFDWSHDRDLACVRGMATNNIVMISNFK